MLLRNKKTGEILESARSSAVIKDKFRIYDERNDKYYTYNSLAELNEEWEDYEEPKEYWFMNSLGEVIQPSETTDWVPEDIIYHKEIGNYFETKEEAEQAVEKLKAWKKLKDNCNFRFNGVERDVRGRLIGVKVEFDKAQVTFDTAKRCYQILDLLFGGKE